MNTNLTTRTDTNPFRSHGHAVRENGWRAIPVPWRQKGPKIRQWQARGVPTRDEIDRLANLPAINMGVVLGRHEALPPGEHVVTIDIDVTHPVSRDAIISLVQASIPGAPLRTGNPHKGGAFFLRVKAADGSPEPRLTDSDTFVFDSGQFPNQRVEVRGDRKQCLIFGGHPIGSRFEWMDGRSPANTVPTDLPLLADADLSKLVSRINSIMESFGGKRVGGQNAGAVERPSVDSQQLTRQRTAGANLRDLDEGSANELLGYLAKTPNVGIGRAEWVNFCKAIFWACRRSLGEEAVSDALFQFDLRREDGPGGDADELRKVLDEHTPPKFVGVRQILRVMQQRGVRIRPEFTAELDFLDLPNEEGESPRSALPEQPCVQLESALDAMNRKFAVAVVGGDTRIVRFDEDGSPLPNLMSRSSFFDLEKPSKIDLKGGKSTALAPLWFGWDGRRTYERGLEMRPLAPDGSGPQPGAGVLNTWRGLAVVPAGSAGDWPTIRSYLYEVLCSRDDVLFSWLLNWLAHAVQQPWEKPGTALVLIGKQGAGKTTIEALLKALWHEQHVVTVESERALLGNFNAHLADALMVVANEAFFGRDPRVRDALKALVTDQSRFIERKGVDRVEARCYCRLVITTNHRNPVAIESDARRWAVFEVSGHRAGDVSYFKKLRDVLQPCSPEVAAFLRDLVARPIDEAALRQPPVTGGLVRMISESLDGARKWMWGLLRTCVPSTKTTTANLPAINFASEFEADQEWPEYVTYSALRSNYAEAKRAERFHVSDNDRELPEMMRTIYGADWRSKRMVKGKRIEVVRLGHLEEAREAFAHAFLRGVSDDSIWA